MIMSVTSSKSLDELDQDLRKAVQRHKFGVLNVLKRLLQIEHVQIWRFERARSEADAWQQGHRYGA